jgi:hypothetical protein
MAALVGSGNVYNTCLRIMRSRGYSLTFESTENDFFQWWAEKNGYDFVANNPIELLGLVSIYEYHQPDGPPTDYWWSVDGSNIYDELIGNEN